MNPPMKARTSPITSMARRLVSWGNSDPFGKSRHAGGTRYDGAPMGKAAALSVAVKDRPYTSDGAKTMLLIGSRKRHLQVRWRDCVARTRLEFSMEADEVRVGIDRKSTRLNSSH